tara:strand:- start:230 stop:457 length:228 start_codon:yes stop_codon:yes gene_type:complete
MPQFRLICKDEDSQTTKEFDAMLLKEVVEHTQDFLKGVGYVFEELHVQTYAVPEQSDMRIGGDLDDIDNIVEFDR